MDEFTAIIFCPVCCSNIDVDQAGEVALECGSCETRFIVILEPAKVAAHALHG